MQFWRSWTDAHQHARHQSVNGRRPVLAYELDRKKFPRRPFATTHIPILSREREQMGARCIGRYRNGEPYAEGVGSASS
jgi:hypothetical protein